MHRRPRRSLRSILRANRRSAASVLLICLAGAGVLLGAAAASWHLTGGRWFVIRTASMGQAGPVGTLVLTRPTSIAATHVGDIISFHAPGSGEVYTHRVVAKTPAGLRTQGDANAVPDSWALTNTNLIGKVTHRWWGVGWILRALPLVLLCLAVLWLLTALIPHAWRSPTRLAGAALTFAFASLVLHPWLGVEKIDVVPADGGGARIRVVSTGILPIRVTGGAGNGSVRLVDGQVGTILVRHPAANGAYHLDPSLSLSLGWWIAVIAVCLVPLAWTTLVGLSPASPAGPRDTSEDGADARTPRDERAASDRRSPATPAGLPRSGGVLVGAHHRLSADVGGGS